MKKILFLFTGKALYLGLTCISAFALLFVFLGCNSPANPDPPPLLREAYTAKLRTFAPGAKLFVLTFDDGPSNVPGAPHTENLLNALNNLNAGLTEDDPNYIKATMFLIGMRIDALDPILDTGINFIEKEKRKTERRALVQRMLADGHEVANHSYTHTYLGGGTFVDGIVEDGLSIYDIPDISGIPELAKFKNRQWPLNKAEIANEIQECQDTIQKAIYGDDNYKNFPYVSKFFRTPFTSIENTTNLENATAELNLPIIHGPSSDDYFSWHTPQEIADIIWRDRYEKISINHDPVTGTKIIDVLNIIIPRLKDEGWYFVTLSELDNHLDSKLIPGQIYVNF